MCKNCYSCMNFVEPEFAIDVQCKRVSRATKYKPRKNQITEDQFIEYLFQTSGDDAVDNCRDIGCPQWVSAVSEPEIFDMDCEVDS